MKYFGVILPGGNSKDFPRHERELKKRKIKFGVINLPSDGRIYMFRESELSKLPHDEKGPYFGDDDSGHTIYEITDDIIEDLT